jgi:hypothetical protein
MSSPSLSGLFQVGIDILKSKISAVTKAVLVQTGDVANESPEADNVEWWQHAGFVSLPSDPKAKQAACQGVIIRRGDHDVCIASRDLRGLELAGQLKTGETCLYGGGSDGKAQGRMLIKQNGSVNIYTRKDNSPTGTGMGIFVNPEDDSISIVNSKGYGLLIKSDGVYLTSGDAGLSLKGDSAKLVATGQTQVDGAGILIGAAGVPGANSALAGVSGVAGVASSKVLIQLV